MPQSLALVLLHIIFSTKNRMPLLQSAELRSEVHAYLTATLQGLGCIPLQVGGVADHVHILCALSRRITIADLIRVLKTRSTKNLKEKGHGVFGWQTGYGAFSVSQSARQSVLSYIAEQETHHRQMSFQEEFRALLNKHGIGFDGRYIWD